MTQWDKLKMQTENKADENFKKLAELFPNAVTEAIVNGEVVRAIDKDVLMQEISTKVVEGREERYQFNWPDKRKAILAANAPINKTLRPCREESVDFDNTQNLYIEGNNLEVLKLLQETYLGKVKMIYIDPPYNTGNDFIYNDNFKQNTDEYLDNSGQFDEDGNRMVQNPESNGRYHTDWLNMMYPRLKLAKDLLSDDGVIFISMADNEIGNLLKICEERFGKKNIEVFVWKKKGGAGNTEKILGVLTEYLICCFRNKKIGDFNYREIPRKYKYKDDKGDYNLEGIEKTNLGMYERATMRFAIIDPKTGIAFYPNDNMRWTIGEQSVKKLINDNKIFFDYEKMKVKIIKRADDYSLSNNVFYNLLIDEGSLSIAKDEILELLGNRECFDTPKPLALIKKLLNIGSKNNSLVLDFFSGSATTAHAVMQLNAEDGGNRKFIMVQLPELTDENSEAFKAGYKNICEIGKERIRCAGKKIKEDNKDKEGIDKLDIGIRVLKCDSSNMKDVYYTPEQYNADLFENLADNIKTDRTPEDLLFQVMLDLGVMLSSKIETINISGKKVFSVEDGFLIACFDDNVTDEVITEIAKQQPDYFVMRDSSIASDSVAANFEQIFATYSPKTERKVL